MQAKAHFLTLDFLRGTAALSVVAFHWLWGQGIRSFSYGYLAVDFFFLLSGFVIAHAYEAKLNGSMPTRQFLWARFVRLYPMILAGVALGLFRELLRSHFDPETAVPYWEYGALAVLNSLLIPIFFSVPFNPERIFPLNDVHWSLFFEVLVNLVFALLVRRLRSPLLMTIVAIGLVGLLASVYLGPWPGGSRASNFIAAIPRVTFSFFLGVLIYRWRSRGAWPNLRVGPLVLSVLLATMFAASAGSLPKLAELCIILAGFPAILVLGANSEPKGILAKASTLLGNLSYPIYAIHIPVIWTMAGALTTLHLYNRTLVIPLLPVVLAVVCAMSWLLLKLYDEPTRKWLAGRFRFAPRVAAQSRPILLDT